MKFRLLSFSAVALLLTACVNSTPVRDSVRHFVPVAPEGYVPAIAGAARVGIRAVELPDYLRGPKIALRKDGAELVYSDFRLWGEPLEGAVARLLSERLSARFGVENVDRFPWAAGACPVQLTVQLDRFEGEMSGAVIASGRIIVEALGRDGYPRVLPFSHKGSWDSADWASLARALGEAVDAIAAEAAAAIPAAK